MKMLIASLILLGGISAPAGRLSAADERAESWSTFRHQAGWTLRHPSDWRSAPSAARGADVPDESVPAETARSVEIFGPAGAVTLALLPPDFFQRLSVQFSVDRKFGSAPAMEWSRGWIVSPLKGGSGFWLVQTHVDQTRPEAAAARKTVDAILESLVFE